MKNRRIAVVSDAVMPFNKGGKERRIQYLTEELVRQGFQVDIYTMKWWHDGKTFTQNGVTFHALCRLHSLYAGKRRSIPEALLFSLSCLKMLRYDFDIMEVDHMPVFPLFSTKIVSLLKRRPLYATWHEVWGRQYWQEYLGTYRGLIAYILERFSVKMPNHIIAVSEQTRFQLSSKLGYQGPITLVRNAIDTSEIDPIIPATEYVDILFVGRLIAHKNVDLLIKAIAKLVPTIPNLRCTIIGGGPEKFALEKLVQTLGLAHNVTLRGFVESNDDVIAQMKSTGIFVSPSEREGFGITVLEALTCGSRIVTVNCQDNAARFLVTKSNGTVCALTVSALANAMRKELTIVSKNHERRDRKNIYDWQASADILHEAYAA
jgi:glycosyltransferase involved in cell wall biosynthesis